MNPTDSQVKSHVRQPCGLKNNVYAHTVFGTHPETVSLTGLPHWMLYENEIKNFVFYSSSQGGIIHNPFQISFDFSENKKINKKINKVYIKYTSCFLLVDIGFDCSTDNWISPVSLAFKKTCFITVHGEKLFVPAHCVNVSVYQTIHNILFFGLKLEQNKLPSTSLHCIFEVLVVTPPPKLMPWCSPVLKTMLHLMPTISSSPLMLVEPVTW